MTVVIALLQHNYQVMITALPNKSCMPFVSLVESGHKNAADVLQQQLEPPRCIYSGKVSRERKREKWSAAPECAVYFTLDELFDKLQSS